MRNRIISTFVATTLSLTCCGGTQPVVCDSVQVSHWQSAKDSRYKVSYRCWNGELNKEVLVIDSLTRVQLSVQTTETDK
jgi:hypothetical protein